MSAEDSGNLVDIGASQLCIRCTGYGTPTVVIDAGLGEGLNAWTSVQAQLATLTRVCAYDRAGIGRSSPGPKPRTSRQMVSELRSLLSHMKVDGPYVLVGHSLGGLNAQLYAAAYPAEVAGMVLVDPSFPDMLSRLKPVLGRIWAPLWNSQFASDAEGMTQQDFAASCAQAAAAGNLPDVPLVVLSAGQPVQLPPIISALFPSAATLRVMQEGHASLAKRSSKGRQIIAEHSTHASIARDDSVVGAIRQVIEQARGTG